MSPVRRPVTGVADLLNPAAALLPAANVIMQLSLPGVGYGVLESPVDSGNVYKHPFKRARTTGTYLAVATIGTDSDRALIRAALDTAHRQVRSTASSPVSYNAFDPGLQLWVAACLYRYFVDQHEYLHGPLDEATADAVYLDARRLGTTLQVREAMWPPDRAAFDDYWKRALADLRIDPPVREHLRGVAAMAFLPWPLRAIAGPFNLFATTGFLPPEFRDHDAVGLVRIPATAIRVVTCRPAGGRPTDSPPSVDRRLPALSVGYARARAPGLAGRLGLDEDGEHDHADNSDDGQPEPRLEPDRSGDGVEVLGQNVGVGALGSQLRGHVPSMTN